MRERTIREQVATQCMKKIREGVGETETEIETEEQGR